jgi:hypothetical protein
MNAIITYNDSPCACAHTPRAPAVWLITHARAVQVTDLAASSPLLQHLDCAHAGVAAADVPALFRALPRLRALRAGGGDAGPCAVWVSPAAGADPVPVASDGRWGVAAAAAAAALGEADWAAALRRDTAVLLVQLGSSPGICWCFEGEDPLDSYHQPFA